MAQRQKGLGLRLGHAIDRWSGGGQRAFVDALKKFVRANKDVDVPTSYRTLVNYLNERTQPSEAWVEAAAVVLRWNPLNLLTGEEPEREGSALDGLKFEPQRAGQEQVSALVMYLNRQHLDMPISARWMLVHFIDDYFGDELEASSGDDRDDVLRSYFGPLFSRPKMPYNETIALAASLTAAAYLRLGGGSRSGPITSDPGEKQ